ncbi:class I SAM-dependent methyltransferase [Pseudonocardia sp. N23]|uniref:class I SAM-dependent methyltransferase n=1 Tax=Pseudonocardia sp. N23 TaxID=1987376 RepID=UPI001145BFDE|nr:class I SAM-dependent methyltransferase [Pseudonocardia sp. N23]
MSDAPAPDLPLQSEDPELAWHLKLVRRYLGAGPYLDHRCAGGRRLRRLAQHGPATGFTADAEVAALAREEAPGCPVVTDPAELGDDAFHGIVAVDGTGALDDHAVLDTITVWRRVLRPGGRILLQGPDAGGRGATLREQPRTPGDRDHARWAELLEEGGLRIVLGGTDGLTRPPYGRVPAGLELRAVASAMQYASGRLYLPPGGGESAVFIAEIAGP